MKKIAVFVSGRGSNFAAVLEQIQHENIPARIQCVISDHSCPPAFEIAEAAGIATHWIHRKQFRKADEYAGFLLALLAVGVAVSAASLFVSRALYVRRDF